MQKERKQDNRMQGERKERNWDAEREKKIMEMKCKECFYQC